MSSNESREIQLSDSDVPAQDAPGGRYVAEGSSKAIADLVRQSQLSLENAQAVAHVGSYEWNTETGAIAWSDELCRIFGFEPGSREVDFDGFLRLVHDEDRELVVDRTCASVDAAEPFQAEFRILRPDGTTRWIEGRGELIKHPDKPAYLIGTGQDITERKSLEAERDRMKAELEASEELFRGAFRASRAGMALIQPSGRYAEVNDAFCDMLGYSREELLTMDWMAVTHPDDLPDNLERSNGMLQGSGPEGCVYEKRFIHKDGATVLCELTDAVITKGDAEHTYFITHARDITTTRALEAGLRQSQKMDAIGQLTAGIAHDFNNLLSVIRNYTQFVVADVQDRSVVPDLQEVSSAADRAAALVRQLLAFSRKEIVAPEVLDVNEVVTSAAHLLTRTLGEHIDLSLRLQPDTGPVLIDSGQLHQLLVNLCVNARDAMPTGGTLIVETKSRDVSSSMAANQPGLAEGRYTTLTIADTGHGIPAEVHDRIFEPFFTTKERGAGTGLGLATAYGIVKQANGFIQLESEVGRGTTFTVFLPATSETAGTAPPTRSLPLGGGEHVLVVEDEPSVRRLLGRILEKAGYRISLAEDGDAAIRLIDDADDVDVMITDVVMPKMSGVELAAAARSRGVRRILYMSGYPYSTLENMGIKDRSQYVEKPLAEADLLSKLRGALDPHLRW